MKKYKKFISLMMVLILLYFLISPHIVFSRTVTEIQEEIDIKKEEMTNVDSEIQKLEEDLESQKQKLAEVSDRRVKLRGEMELNKKEAEIIRRKMKDLEEKQELKDLEKEKRVTKQNKMVQGFYTDWKQTNIVRSILSSRATNMMKVAVYQNAVTLDEQENIQLIEQEILEIQKEYEKAEIKRHGYEARLNTLANQAEKTERLLKELEEKIASNTNDISNYRAKIAVLQSEIEQLTAEQKAIQEYENSLLAKDASNGGTQELQTGDLYFQGVGREIYQGHGVGMSQFGALGAALKGWDYKKILEFYYPGAKVVKYTDVKTINVAGYGTMSVEDYVAGAGEIPDYSCEDLEIKFDHNNIWKCWPKEAIKAQAVAFRTYGLNKTKGGSSICTTARCQVYKGGENKRWAAEETESMVVIYEGEPISAFYSSDNHNGWGTANNDTVWSNFEGEGVPETYLRAVNDKAIAYKYVYTEWTWRTNGYSIEEIDGMLNWSMNSNQASDKYRTFIIDLKASIGELKALEFERDPSGRVNKVKLIGSSKSRYMAGWLFKSLWNIWIGNEKPSGEEDYIYSLTYYMRIK